MESLEERVGFVEGRIEEFGPMAEDLRESIRRLDQRFDQVDVRFERMEARFERIDARFERIDARFERQDDKMTKQYHHLVSLHVMTLVAIVGLAGAMVAALAVK